jgi:hypothetical protein
MRKTILPLFLAFLLLVIGQSGDLSQNVRDMAGVLSFIVLMCVTIIAPLLLVYGFLKGSLDVLKKTSFVSALTLLGATDFTEALRNLTAMFQSLALIILPFTLILLLWKAFTKVVKV